MEQDDQNDLLYLLRRAAKHGPYEWEIRDRIERGIHGGVTSAYSARPEQGKCDNLVRSFNE